MLTMRLQRIGRKNEPHYRVVVTDSRNAPKSGKFIEIVGSYNPKLGNVQLAKERISHWIGNGTQMSDTVHNFFVDQGLVAGRKKNKLPKKHAPIKEIVAETPAEPTPAPVVEEVAVDDVIEETTPEVEAPEVTETESTPEPEVTETPEETPAESETESAE